MPVCACKCIKVTQSHQQQGVITLIPLNISRCQHRWAISEAVYFEPRFIRSVIFFIIQQTQPDCHDFVCFSVLNKNFTEYISNFLSKLIPENTYMSWFDGAVEKMMELRLKSKVSKEKIKTNQIFVPTVCCETETL